MTTELTRCLAHELRITPADVPFWRNLYERDPGADWARRYALALTVCDPLLTDEEEPASTDSMARVVTEIVIGWGIVLSIFGVVEKLWFG